MKPSEKFILCAKFEIFLVIYQLLAYIIRAFSKHFYHLFSMCICLECPSTSLPIQRRRIFFF